MNRNYPQYRESIGDAVKELRQQIPDVLAGFAQVQKAVMREGALSVKHKELIALGLAIGARCEGCIATHINGALKAGASVEEISEALGVAIEMGGVPSVTRKRRLKQACVISPPNWVATTFASTPSAPGRCRLYRRAASRSFPSC